MAEYVIKYEYYTFDMGCGCCHDYESNVEIYQGREDAYMSCFTVGFMENEEELREYIDMYHPEYSNFEVHEDSRWF